MGQITLGKNQGWGKHTIRKCNWGWTVQTPFIGSRSLDTLSYFLPYGTALLQEALCCCHLSWQQRISEQPDHFKVKGERAKLSYWLTLIEFAVSIISAQSVADVHCSKSSWTLLAFLEVDPVNELHWFLRDYLIRNCEKKMGGSEQPVRSIQKTHSKLGRSRTVLRGCHHGARWPTQLTCQRSIRFHL